jgi:Rrf2 family protein
MRVSTKADYAVRATIELASASDESPLTGDQVADAQGIPLHFLENILGELRHHGLVDSRRGAEGGYWLARDPGEITVADVIRGVEGPLASVRGERPQEISYEGSAQPLQRVWIALRANVHAVLEHVTLADLVAGRLPDVIEQLNSAPDGADRN